MTSLRIVFLITHLPDRQTAHRPQSVQPPSSVRPTAIPPTDRTRHQTPTDRPDCHAAPAPSPRRHPLQHPRARLLVAARTPTVRPRATSTSPPARRFTLASSEAHRCTSFFFECMPETACCLVFRFSSLFFLRMPVFTVVGRKSSCCFPLAVVVVVVGGLRCHAAEDRRRVAGRLRQGPHVGRGGEPLSDRGG